MGSRSPLRLVSGGTCNRVLQQRSILSFPAPVKRRRCVGSGRRLDWRILHRREHWYGSGGWPEWELALGPSYEELRPQLKLLEKSLGESLLALDELSDADGQRLLGLQGDVLQQAQRRRCSVPFVAPSPPARGQLVALARERGLHIVQGNRMAHLLGKGVSKGRALHALKQREGVPHVKVLALGDSPNDLPLLEVADMLLSCQVQMAHPELRSGVSGGCSSLPRPPRRVGPGLVCFPG